jgi:ribose-phosphate pyrophosphokinase
MSISLFCGSANPALAGAVAGQLGVPLGGAVLERFPDGETHVQLQDSVRGGDVYIVQPTSPPVAENLLELLLLADACRRAGARRLTGVVPYFGYARADRRARGREAIGARLICDLMRAGGLERIVSVDLHTAAVEGFFSGSLEHLSAVPLLAEAVRPQVKGGSVIVAPDLGAAHLARHYGVLLGLPVALVHKTRISGTEVSVSSIVGDVAGLAPVIVDDMISTGGTIEAAVKALLGAGAAPEVSVLASHALLVGPAVDRLRNLSLRSFIVTDSVLLPGLEGMPLQVVGLAPLLAEAIRRLHHDRSMADLIFWHEG